MHLYYLRKLGREGEGEGEALPLDYIIDKIIDIITLIDIINKREREVFTLKQTLFDIIDRREGEAPAPEGTLFNIMI